MKYVLAALTTIFFVTAAAATAHTQPIRTTSSERTAQIQLHSLARTVASLRKATWECQDTLGVPRTRAQDGTWALPRSIPYRTRVVVPKWRTAKASCASQLRNRTIPSTWDWPTAVRMVQRIYPGTQDWLLYISQREGGWGRFVMNTQGSGAGGWMQFMSSTFYAYNDRAFADARRRGFILDERANTWTHPLGQAVTAGYMRYVGLDGCHWCL